MSIASMKTAMAAAYGEAESFYDEFATIIVTHADGGGGATLGKSSVTNLTASTSSASRYNPFDDGSHSAYVEDTNWQHNITDGWAFDHETGLWTCPTTGAYRVSGLLIINGGTNTVDVEIEQDGSPVWTASPLIHASVDPAPMPFDILLEVTEDETIGLFVDGVVAITIQPGSTLNIAGVA